jgi:hypothetical protein
VADGPRQDAEWELWSWDYFDRDSAPLCDARGRGRVDGVATLLRATLDEGLLDDGRPTFTWFELRIAGRRNLSLPRDPLMNPELAKLRAWKDDPGLIDAVAQGLTLRPGEVGFQVLFDAIQMAKDGAELKRWLSPP